MAAESGVEITMTLTPLVIMLLDLLRLLGRRHRAALS